MKNNTQHIGAISNGESVKDSFSSPIQKSPKGDNYHRVTIAFLCILLVGLLLWNIFYTCTKYPRDLELKPDYMGIIFTALSVLVMFLLGWQIFSVFSIKKDVDKTTEKFKQDIEASEILLKQRISDEVALAKAEAFTVISLSTFDSNQLDVSIPAFYKSIDCCFDCSVRDDKFLKTLAFAKKVMNLLKTKEISFSEEQLEVFKKTAKKSGDFDIIAYTQDLFKYKK